jgi:hypothetical protein
MSSRKSAKERARAARLAREAELRAKAKRRRLRVRAGALVGAAVALAAGIALASSHGQGQQSGPAPAVKLTSLSTLGTLTSPPAAGPPGPEGVPLPGGADVAMAGAAQHPVDGIQCLGNEQLAFHIHAHLTLFDHGIPRRIPAGVGIEGPQPMSTPQGIFVGGGSCFYWLHTHAEDGIVHIESPNVRSFTLGDFFDVWGQKLGRDRVGPATGPVTTLYNGKLFEGNPRQIPLTAHAQIQLDVGRPLVAPVSVGFPGGL